MHTNEAKDFDSIFCALLGGWIFKNNDTPTKIFKKSKCANSTLFCVCLSDMKANDDLILHENTRFARMFSEDV